MKRITSILLLICVPFLYLNAQKDSLQDIQQLLQLSLEQLMDIKVVSATGIEQTTSEAPSTITIITAQQIEERGYEQLEDALRDVPGIDMIHINGYVPTLIYFRGMYGAENLRALLMIDGIAENNIIGSNDLAGPAYNLANASRIEIIWGPVSALYGSNAFGGVINIITKKGAELNGLQARQAFGSFNTRQTTLDLGSRTSNLEFAVSGSIYTSDGPRFKNRDRDYSGSYVNNAYSFNTTIGHYGKFGKTSFAFRTYRTPMGWGTYSNSPTVYLGLPSQGNNNNGTLGVLARSIRGERSGLIDSYLRTFYLSQENTFGKVQLTGTLTYRETGTADDSYIYVTADGRKLIRVLVASSSNRLSGKLTGRYSPSRNSIFSAGIEYFQDNVEEGGRHSTIDVSTIYLVDGRDTVLNLKSNFLPRAFDIRNNIGSYIQFIQSTSLFGKTVFTAGLRYDHNSYFSDALNPRISIVNQPDSTLTFKFQYGKAFRAPSNIEIYQTPGGNFQITPEKITTYEINAIYTIKKSIRLQLNAFRNDLRDVILLGNLSGTTPNKNPGSMTVTGVEFSADMITASRISPFVNFTFQHAREGNLLNGMYSDVAGIAKVKGNAGLLIPLDKQFKLSVIGNWVGKRTPQLTNPYGPVEGYLLTNLTLSAGNLFDKRITMSLALHNIFNVKWLDPGFRTADGFLYSTVLEQPGINGLFKIGIDL